MARMLGAFLRPWCPICGCVAGPDCPTKAVKSKRAQKARERREWMREEVA